MTTPTCKLGTYGFMVMPFGLMIAPATFQRIINEMLKDLSFRKVCFDYIVVFTGSEQHNARDMAQVLKRVSDAGLRIELKKCIFRQPEARLFGQVVSKRGMGVDEDKIKSVVHAPTPTSKTELKSFVELVS